MRKLLIAGVAVASLTGIAYAQVGSPSDAELRAWTERVRERTKNPPTCVDADGATRKLEETANIGPFQFRCVETFGDRVKSNGANWIQVEPLRARYVTFD